MCGPLFSSLVSCLARCFVQHCMPKAENSKFRTARERRQKACLSIFLTVGCPKTRGQLCVTLTGTFSVGPRPIVCAVRWHGRISVASLEKGTQIVFLVNFHDAGNLVCTECGGCRTFPCRTNGLRSCTMPIDSVFVKTYFSRALGGSPRTDPTRTSQNPFGFGSLCRFAPLWRRKTCIPMLIRGALGSGEGPRFPSNKSQISHVSCSTSSKRRRGHKTTHNQS
jgi:hypothetical protein